MPDHDPLVSYLLASHVAEVSSAFHISVSRSPVDGMTNEAQVGKVRELRVHLEYETEGRGNRNMHEFPTRSVPIDRFGMGKADITLDVPFNAPISYDGDLIRVKYEIVIVTDIQRAFDDSQRIPVVVAPVGGANTYQRPHPLTTG